MVTMAVRLIAAAFWGALFAAVAIAQSGSQPGSAAASQSGPRMIENPSGGRIFYGTFAGQPTQQEALGRTLHRLSVYCGDRPQPGQVLQAKNGDLVATFFTVTGKNQDGKPMAGVALVYAPMSGTSGGAVLLDYADRFPSTANSMFQRLKQEIAGSQPESGAQASGNGSASSHASAQSSTGSAAPVKSAPPQQLQAAPFPDGSGVIGLPAGWQLVQAHLGDVMATGPHGEKLRFGMTISVIDPSNPQSRQLGGGRSGAPGKFVAVPYSADGATVFKSAAEQLARKSGHQAPTINIAKVQEVPMQGGRNYMLFGDVDAHDGQGPQSMVAQEILAPPQMMGAWQITIFQAQAPPQVMAQESATIAEIFPSYNRNSRMVNAVVNQQIQQGIEQTNQFVGQVQRSMDTSDRLTAGVSDTLRERTVLLDTETGGHARTSDQLAGALIDANPNRFQAVPLSNYIKGIDY